MPGQYEKQARLQRLLKDCADSADKGRITRTFTAHGLKWTMMPLNDHEANWRNKYIIPGSLLSIQTSQKAPTLAIGIRAIGPVDADNDKLDPVEEFFKEDWDKLKAQLRNVLETNDYARQFYLAEMLYEWLGTRPPEFVDELWSSWLKLTSEQTEAENRLGESSREKELTPTGQSSQEDSMPQLTPTPTPKSGLSASRVTITEE